MIDFVTGTLIPFLFVLTVLVFIHELGHYLVARWNGVRVETFSVGFGPELFGRTDKHGTRWRVSALPLGGYVKMLGGEQSLTAKRGDPPSPEMLEHLEEIGITPEQFAREAFPAKRLGQRAAIVAAGPLANFVLSAVLFAGLFMIVGAPTTQTIAGPVEPGSAAEAAGILPDDRIVAVDGEEVETFEQLLRIIRFNRGTPIELLIERDGASVMLTATPILQEVPDGLGGVTTIGTLGIGGTMQPIAGSVDSGSAAEAAGVQPGDRILAVDDVQVETFDKLREIITLNRGTPVELLIDRGGSQMTVTATPTVQQETNGADGTVTVGRLGIRPSMPVSETLDPFSAVVRGVEETYDLSVMTVQAVGQIIVGSRGTEDIGGLPRIGQMAGEVAALGFAELIQFMAILSISLGLINLVPIPVLDGGHLLFYAIEAVRGRPLSRRAIEVAMSFGLVVIVGLFITTTVLDLMRFDGIVAFFNDLTG